MYHNESYFDIDLQADSRSHNYNGSFDSDFSGEGDFPSLEDFLHSRDNDLNLPALSSLLDEDFDSVIFNPPSPLC